jgi:teichuronic acid biosynthesis glycosyltransferase TuaG
MDLVTVIIPYYKKKNYIVHSVESAISQTYRNLEIIIIYDNESDSELDYIKSLKNRDFRIKLIINESNLGAGESRNKGIKFSKGKYISFLDADDMWKKNKIETQLLFMQYEKLNISHTSYKIIDEENNLIGNRKARSFYNYKDIIKSCDIGLSSVMLKKEIISNDIKFSNLKTKEDFYLWLKILKKGIKIIAIDEELLIWRKTKNSLSGSTLQKLSDGFKIYNRYMGYNFFISIYYLICLSLNYLKKKIND